MSDKHPIKIFAKHIIPPFIWNTVCRYRNKWLRKKYIQAEKKGNGLLEQGRMTKQNKNILVNLHTRK
jgi:hypothetical protein